MTTARTSANKPRRAPARLGRPPGQTSENTRKRILLAARECFARVGFERATNRDIAASAGVTAAAIYRYFDSKPELYTAVVHDAVAELVPLMRAAVASEPDVRGALRAVLQILVGMDEDHAQAARFLSGLPFEMQRHPEVASRMLADPGEVFAIITDLVAKGVRTKQIPRDKSERVVAMMIATLMGLSQYAIALGDAAGKQAVAGFIDLFDERLFSRSKD
ncbi:MAG TPA: TetR/AcrR family transcriptional regulator [Polyangiales bacterium]|nr:TetR/AcrR family transcriptional regulator [Polyangiales bacterium]